MITGGIWSEHLVQVFSFRWSDIYSWAKWQLIVFDNTKIFLRQLTVPTFANLTTLYSNSQYLGHV